MAQVRFDLTGDATDLVAALETVIGEFKKVENSAKAADKAVDNVSNTGTKAAGSTNRLAKGIEAVDKAAGAIGGSVGDGVSKIKGFGEATAAASEALGPWGIAIAAGVAAVAALAVGVAAAGAAMVATVAKAEELNKALKPFEDIEGFEPIAPETLASIENVNDAMSSLQTIFDRFVVTLGGEFAPALEKGSFILVKLGLMALDSFQKFADGKDLLREFAAFLIREFIQSLLQPIDMLFQLIGVMGDLANAVGMTGLGKAFKDAKGGWEALSDAVAGGIVDAALGATSDAMDGLNGATSDYDARARELLGTNREQKDALTGVAKAAREVRDIYKEMQAAGEDLIDISAQINDDLLTERDRIKIAADERHNAIMASIADLESLLKAEETTAAEREAILADLDYARTLLADNEARRLRDLGEIEAEELEAKLERYEEATAKYLEMVEEQKQAELDARREVEDAALGAYNNITDAFQSLIQMQIDKEGELTESQKQQVLTAFHISQAAALVQIAINTAVAITRALAELGPVAGGFAVAGITATGVAQAAVVAAQKPPEFAFGGIVDEVMRSSRTSADHGLISAQPGEAVLNRGAVSRLGRQGVDDLNRGGGRPASIVVVNQYKHKVFDSFVQDNLSRGGPLSDALFGVRRPGHSRRAA